MADGRTDRVNPVLPPQLCFRVGWGWGGGGGGGDGDGGGGGGGGFFCFVFFGGGGLISKGIYFTHILGMGMGGMAIP